MLLRLRKLFSHLYLFFKPSYLEDLLIVLNEEITDSAVSAATDIAVCEVNNENSAMAGMFEGKARVCLPFYSQRTNITQLSVART